MHVLLLADGQFAEHERALLERIAAGLLGESVRTTLALPKNAGTEFSLVSEPIRYSNRGLIFTQRIRAQQVAERVAGSDRDRAVNVIHVFGGAAWPMGLELAEIFHASIAFEIWRGGLVDRAASIKVPAHIPLAFFAPDRPIERALVEAGITSPIRVTPWGAYAPPRPTPVLKPGRSASIVFCSAGRDTEACRAAFSGVCRVIADRDDIMLFVAESAAHRAGLWSLAEQAGVLDRVSLMDRLEDRRDLVLRCDMLVYPDARHEQRTLLLDAMAHGLVIVAAPDPQVSIIRDQVTAAVPKSLTPAGWADAVTQRLADRAGSVALGLSAREHVRQHRRASAHIASLVDAYTDLARIDSISMQTDRA
ncbi:MAG: glycosyltransferase [Phycisphaerales bacterium]|nr:glycosyltransferase [Planctomycetota bacterium]MCH8507802.1 glycosyltransferase [Phycisphaerales bacterium]